MVLGWPEIPLHTNGSENEYPLPGCQAQDQRRNDTGRDCRAAFRGLSKTCANLGIAFCNDPAPGSPFRATPKSTSCRTSSSTAAFPDDRHGFFPSYRVRHGAKRSLERIPVIWKYCCVGWAKRSVPTVAAIPVGTARKARLCPPYA
jgi:hypothetical protein